MPPTGTAENVAGSASGTSSTGNLTSGTASEAMIKAATAASSAEPTPTGEKVGDTSSTAGAANTGATAGAIAQPGETGKAAAAVATTQNGPVPFDRHEIAVKNAREAGRAEAEQQSPFKGMDAGDVRIALGVLADLRKDPKAFWQSLGSEIGSVQEPKEEADETFPVADLISDKGVKAYSDGTLLKILDIHGRNLTKKLMGELKPLQDRMRTQDDAESEGRVRAFANQATAEARKLPHFKENETAIIEKMRAMDPALKRAIGPIAAMHSAYNQVLAEKVFPNIETTATTAAEARLRESYAKKANAGAGVHPTDQGGEAKTPRLRDGDVGGLARHMEKLAEASV